MAIGNEYSGNAEKGIVGKVIRDGGCERAEAVQDASMQQFVSNSCMGTQGTQERTLRGRQGWILNDLVTHIRSFPPF